MSTFRYGVIDVFTEVPLQGNHLAVFTDAREIPENLLLREDSLPDSYGWNFWNSPTFATMTP